MSELINKIPPPDFPPIWAGGWGEDEHGYFAELVIGGVCMEMRWIPPGRFLVGSPEDEAGRSNNEGPRHEVILTRGLWLAATPCTQEQWRAWTRNDPSQNKGARHPVEKVSWVDVERECQNVNELIRNAGVLPQGFEFRLPTEAEWEYACRAGTESAFNDGSACTKPEGKDASLDQLGWYSGNSGNMTHSVREKAPNARGLFDMHGNVWEWCIDSMRAYGKGEWVDPVGRLDGQIRVVRGGSAWGNARFCRSAYRLGFEPGYRYFNLGFRLAAGQPVPDGSGTPGGAGGRRDDDQTEPTRRGAGAAGS